MQKLRPIQMLDVFKGRNEGIEVVAVNRADVVKTKFFKQGGRYDHALGLLLEASCQVKQRRRIFQDLLAHLFGGRVKTPAHELRQIAIERSHGRADGHVVVVEDDQQIGVRHTGVVEGFKRHACGHGAVANDGHTSALLAFLLGRQGHA